MRAVSKMYSVKRKNIAVFIGAEDQNTESENTAPKEQTNGVESVSVAEGGEVGVHVGQKEDDKEEERNTTFSIYRRNESDQKGWTNEVKVFDLDTGEPHTHTCTHTSTCTCTYACTYIYEHVQLVYRYTVFIHTTCTCSCIFMCIHITTFMHTYMYMYVCNMHAYIYNVYTRMHVHVHISLEYMYTCTKCMYHFVRVLCVYLGLWSSQPTSGTTPPPSVDFSFTCVDKTRTVVFGGYQPETGITSDTFVLDTDTWVSCVGMHSSFVRIIHV